MLPYKNTYTLSSHVKRWEMKKSRKKVTAFSFYRKELNFSPYTQNMV